MDIYRSISFRLALSFSCNQKDEKILATAYLKDEEMLISLASLENKTTSVRLNIDFRETGMDPDRLKIIAPPIRDFQEGREFRSDEPIPVEPTKGWLLIIKKQ